MTETDLQRSILSALTATGCWVMRLNAGGKVIETPKARQFIRLAPAGTPDIMVLAPVWGFLEVKTTEGKLTDAQREWHARAERCGVRVAVVRSIGEAISAVKGWSNGR